MLKMCSRGSNKDKVGSGLKTPALNLNARPNKQLEYLEYKFKIVILLNYK